MQELIHIVVELLSKHSCVIIPNFGGFVVNEKSAVADSGTDYFFPPQKELIFNPHLSHNDGLLAHALMQKKSISFDEADEIVAKGVEQLKTELKEHKMCTLGDWGFFSFERGNILFHAKNIKIENVDSFGLKEFYFPSLHAAKDTRPFDAGEKKKTPVSKALMGGIAAAIALFLVCQPIQNEGGSDYASLAPLSFTNYNLILDEKANSDTLKSTDYHLVLNEFDTEEEAASFIGLMELQEGDTLQLVPVDEKFLLVFASSENLNEMSEKMKDFRSRYDLQFPDAFVLGLR